MTPAEYERQQRINAYQQSLHIEYMDDYIEAAWRWQLAMEALGAGEQYERLSVICDRIERENGG